MVDTFWIESAKNINLNKSMFKKALFLTVLAVTLFYITIEHFYIFMLKPIPLNTNLNLETDILISSPFYIHKYHK